MPSMIPTPATVLRWATEVLESSSSCASHRVDRYVVMKMNKQKAAKRIALILAVLMLLPMAACGKAEPAETTEPASTTAPVDEAEYTPKPATASAGEIGLDGLKTLDDVRAYLDTVLPYQGEEELIPYVADIYHAGECTLTFYLYGFCTRTGELVTKPVFSDISVVRGLAADGTVTENLYLCWIPAFGCSPVLFTFNGTQVNDRRYEELPQPAGLIGGGLGDIIDDGFYYLDGYTMNEAGYGEFIDHPGNQYDICRKSDGVKVAVTEAPSWPGFNLVDLGNGDRLYYTLLDGVCTTWDNDFHPIMQVPALGAHSSILFENTPEQGEQEETLTANPAEQGDLFTLSDTQQYAANLSLSNFSEQWFCESRAFDHYDAANTSIAQLYMFARLWNKINRPTEIEYKDGYETMTRETFFEIIGPRIDYPNELELVEGEDFSDAFGIGNFDWNRSWYENGRFYYPAGDGESYNRFTVVEEAYKLHDGSYRFRFTIYELDLDIYWDEQGVPPKYYHLTPAEAEKYAAEGTITAVRKGTAVCSPIYWESSGKEMYLLEYYELDHRD